MKRRDFFPHFVTKSKKKDVWIERPVWGIPFNESVRRCETGALFMRNPGQGVFYELLFVMVLLF